MQNKNIVSVLTSSAHHSVGQFIVPIFECCDSCITQVGVLIFPLHSILQKSVLQTKALQKVTTNKATLTSSGTIRQGNNPEPVAHIILPIKHRKNRPWEQNQDSEKLWEWNKLHPKVWELDRFICHLLTWQPPHDHFHYSNRN